MGWQPGGGLGRELQGPSSCLRLSANEGSSGVGHKKGRWGASWWEAAFDDALQAACNTQPAAKTQISESGMSSGSSSESSSSDEDEEEEPAANGGPRDRQVEEKLAKKWARSRCSGKMARIKQMEKREEAPPPSHRAPDDPVADSCGDGQDAKMETSLPTETLADDPTVGLQWWGQNRFAWGGLLSETDARRKMYEKGPSFQGNRSTTRQQSCGFSEALQEQVYHAAEQSKSSGKKGLGRRQQQAEASKTSVFSGTHIKFAKDHQDLGAGKVALHSRCINKRAKDKAGTILKNLVNKWRKANVGSKPLKKVYKVIVNRLGKNGMSFGKETRTAWKRWLRKHIRENFSKNGGCTLHESVLHIGQSE